MKRRGLVAMVALAMSVPVGAAEQQPEQPSGSQQQTYTPSLAVEMGLIQVSHFKLWLAGNVRNWPLAEYQLSQMKKTLHEDPLSGCGCCRHQRHIAVRRRASRCDQDQGWRQIRRSL
jgi:hypothetical protein